VGKNTENHFMGQKQLIAVAEIMAVVLIVWVIGYIIEKRLKKSLKKT
jgi:hypothetical protein